MERDISVNSYLSRPRTLINYDLLISLLCPLELPGLQKGLQYELPDVMEGALKNPEGSFQSHFSVHSLPSNSWTSLLTEGLGKFCLWLNSQGRVTGFQWVSIVKKTSQLFATFTLSWWCHFLKAKIRSMQFTLPPQGEQEKSGVVTGRVVLPSQGRCLLLALRNYVWVEGQRG